MQNNKFKAKFKKEQIYQVKLNMFKKEKFLPIRNKKRDSVCRNCLKTFEELNSDISLMTIHGKPNVILCESCGKEYIKLGAIDIQAQKELGEERQKELEPYKKYLDENLKKMSYGSLSKLHWKSIIERLEKRKVEAEEEEEKENHIKEQQFINWKKTECIEEKINFINQELEDNKIYNISPDELCTGTPFFDEFSKNLKLVEKKLNSDSHRWYILHEDVYDWINPVNKEIHYIGIWHVGEHKSEMQSDSDVGHTPSLSVKKKTTKVTYI